MSKEYDFSQFHKNPSDSRMGGADHHSAGRRFELVSLENRDAVVLSCEVPNLPEKNE
jgi:hypothetical protein